MRKLSLPLLLLLPLAAHADPRPCANAQPRDLKLDLAGVDTVMFDIGHSTIDVRAAPGASGMVTGKACASDAKNIDGLQLVQEKHGHTLTVRAMRNGVDDSGSSVNINILGIHVSTYSYLVLSADVPDYLLVQLKVGSGDATISGARAASADVGSGEVKASNIREQLTAKVGSGDLDAEDIGSLHLLSVGSGDVIVKRVRGPAKIGSVGSGDVSIEATMGSVEIGSIGSGDAIIKEISGDVGVGSVGSGDLDVDGVRGGLKVDSVGSGDVSHHGVSGRVDVPKDD